jgi:LysM repeat protein
VASLAAVLVLAALVLIVSRATAPPDPQIAAGDREAADLLLEAPRPLRTAPPLGLYVVQPGDTLMGIAEAGDSSIEILSTANDIPDFNLVREGETLRVPPVGTSLRRANPELSASEIARREGFAVETILEYNGLGADVADHPFGRVAILLPPGADPAPPEADSEPAFGAERAVEPTTYRVRPGDTLIDVAWRLGIDVDTIVNNNEDIADADSIKAGDSLLVLPVSGLLYRVEPGDSLSAVSERFGVGLDSILEFNHLPDVDAVLIGSQIILPGAGPGGYFRGSRSNDVRLGVPYRSQLDGTPWQGANCGPVSLGMGLESLGIWVSSTDLRRQVLAAQGFGGNASGTLLDALARVAARNGARTIGLEGDAGLARWSPDDIRSQLRAGRPVIVQVRYRALPGRGYSAYAGDHYIVLSGLAGETFLYNDPLDIDGPGRNRQMTAGELERAMNASDRRYAYAAFALSA